MEQQYDTSLREGKMEKSKKEEADLVFENGSIYTVDAKRSWAEAVAIRDGSIVYVGKNDGLTPYKGADTKVIDLKGKMVLPGFFDAHCHASQGAILLTKAVDLVGFDSVEAYEEVVAKFAADNPEPPVIQGLGWSNTLFGMRGPNKGLLDCIVPERPAVFYSEDGHSLWVNSKALEAAGITKGTADPKGGTIERDLETGEATGTLRESAMGLVSKNLPDFTEEDYIEGFIAFQEKANALGFTTVHDPLLYHKLGGADFPPSDNSARAIERLQRERCLTIRYRGSWAEVPERSATKQISAFSEESKEHTGDLFQAHSIKLFADGVIEGGTAYLLEPYANEPGNWGKEFSRDYEAYREAIMAFDKAGFQVHVHAIGDAATRMTLDAFEYAQRINGKRDSRHSITHLQLVAPEDIDRMAKLGVIGLPQPYWFMKDDYYWTLQLPYLGKERADKEYPMKSLIDAGVIMASASDFPVPSTNPFTSKGNPFPYPMVGIYCGVVRSAPGATTDPNKVLKEGESGVLWAEERASLDDMIASFTINGAYANFLENEVGSIEVGKKGDLIVLSNNLFEVPVEKIPKTEVVMTLFKGKIVYER